MTPTKTDFAGAMLAVKHGHSVARYEGRGGALCMVQPSNGVRLMRASSFYGRDNSPVQVDTIRLQKFIGECTPTGYRPYMPTQEDMLADDWVVID